MTKHVVNMAGVLILVFIVSLHAQESGQPVPIRSIYLDQSHDFSLDFGHLGNSLHAPGGFDVTSSLATFPPPDLRDFDAVMLLQWHKYTPFDDNSVRTLVEYVAAGGGAYIVGNSVEFEKSGRSCPIARVWAGFGYGLRVGGQASATTVASQFSPMPRRLDDPKPKPCVLTSVAGRTPALRNVKVVAREAGGGVVAVVGEFGKGRVFLATPLAFAAAPKEASQRDMIINIMRWISRTEDSSLPARRKNAGIRRRDPELVLRAEGIEVLYPAYLKDQAALLARDYPPIHKAIRDFFQWDRPEPLQIIAITGAGFTDPKHIAIGVCDVSDEDRRGFLLFEGSNSTPTPAPEGLGEAWATFVRRELGRAVGADKANERDPWAEVRRQVLPEDPRLDRFDISHDMRSNPLPGSPEGGLTWVQFRKKKCALLLKELYDRHGVALIRRLLRIHFARSDTSRTDDFDTWVRELSLAAGEDLTGFFRARGTTVGNLGLPAASAPIRAAGDEIIRRAQEKARASNPEH